MPWCVVEYEGEEVLENWEEEARIASKEAWLGTDWTSPAWTRQSRKEVSEIYWV
jgi:hypothetical protein